MFQKIKNIILARQGKLSQLALETIRVEKTKGCCGKLEWVHLKRLSNSGTYPFTDWQHPAEWIHCYRIDNVVVDIYHMVLFKNGKIIPDSNPYITGQLLRSLKLQPEKLVEYSGNEAIFSCSDHWENNYYHWMIHAIPAYFAILKLGIKGKFLLTYPMFEWRKRTLELLGIDLSLLIPVEKEKQYAFSQLYVCDFTFGKADFSCSDLSVQAYAQMIRNVSHHAFLRHDKIYISRMGKKNRCLSNEEELVMALEKRGYFILNPEDYTIDEQIMLFHHARIVVGLLGAGLSNIVFCQENTMVYELVPSHHNNPCFLALSLQGKLRYWADRFDTGVKNNAPDHLSPWQNSLDIGFVMKRLDELERYL